MFGVRHTGRMTDQPKKGLAGKLTSAMDSPPPGSFGFWLVKQGANLNTLLYRVTKGKVGGTYDGAPVVLVHHIGAKSGEARVAPVVYLADGDDVIIVASYGGAPKSPAWFHNLKANPDTKMELRGETIPVRAEVVAEPERSELWTRVVQLYPAFADYQRKTERIIPIVRLRPTS